MAGGRGGGEGDKFAKGSDRRDRLVNDLFLLAAEGQSVKHETPIDI